MHSHDLFIIFHLQTFPVIPTLVCEKSVASVGDIMPGQCTPYQKLWTMKCLNEGIKTSEIWIDLLNFFFTNSIFLLTFLPSLYSKIKLAGRKHIMSENGYFF